MTNFETLHAETPQQAAGNFGIKGSQPAGTLSVLGLIIESADIAQAHRNYHQALWQISTPDTADTASIQTYVCI